MTALLAPILQEFFTAHLVTQRAVSAATIRAYRDTWKLFLAFLSERENVPAQSSKPTTSTQQVIAFLDTSKITAVTALQPGIFGSRPSSNDGVPGHQGT